MFVIAQLVTQEPSVKHVSYIFNYIFILLIYFISYFPFLLLVTTACSNNPCQNGGTCQLTGSGSTYTCNCVSGYSGTNCQTYTNACFNNPCINGGTCQVTANGGYVCNCPGTFTGANCQSGNYFIQ